MSPSLRLALPMLLLLPGCHRTPVVISTFDAPSSLAELVQARIQVEAPLRVEVNGFRRTFGKLYGSEQEFGRTFQAGLQAKLGAIQSSTHVLKLRRLVIEAEDEADGSLRLNESQSIKHVTEFCVVTVTYEVVDAQGRTLLEGTAKERTERSDWLSPFESKLRYAVTAVQSHLANYLAGRLPPKQVGRP